jgi:hypothetical protein
MRLRQIPALLLAWLIAGNFLLGASLGAVLIWIATALFLVAMVFQFLDTVPTRPVWATANLAIGWAIGIFILWFMHGTLKSTQTWANKLMKDAFTGGPDD